jgi:N-methylhydantoinase B/oxoprolinase/acetone carboxylase alpha subunit
MRIEAPELRVSMLMDHTKIGPWPVAGGCSGSLAGIVVRRSGEKKFRSFTEVFGTTSSSKFADVRLREGDEIRIESCGGAGYGDPRERDRELVARDIAEGFVSPAAAARIYGARVEKGRTTGKSARAKAHTVRPKARAR